MPEKEHGYGGGYSSYGSSYGGQSSSKSGMQSKQGSSYSSSASKSGMQSKQGSSYSSSASKSGMQGKQGNQYNDSSGESDVSVLDYLNALPETVNNSNSDTQSNNTITSNATVKLGTVKVKNGIYNTESQDNLDKITIIRQLRYLNPTWNDIDIANFIESGGKKIPNKSKFSNESKGVNQASFAELDKLADNLTFGLGLRGDSNIGIGLSRADYGKMLDLLSGKFEAGSETWKRQQILQNTHDKFSSKSDLQKLFANMPSLTNVAGQILGGIGSFFKNEPMAGHEEGINDTGWNNLAIRQLQRSAKDGVLELMPDGSNPLNAVLQLGNSDEVAYANNIKQFLGSDYQTKAFQAQKEKYQKGIDEKYEELYSDHIPEDDIINQGHESSYREEWANLADSLKTGIGSDNISSLYYDGNSLNVNEDFKINTADKRMNEGIDTNSYNISNATTNESIDSETSDEASTTTNTSVAWGGPRDRHSFEWMMTGQRPDGAIETPEPEDVKLALNTYNATQTHKYYYNRFTGKYEHYNATNGTTEELDDSEMRNLLNIQQAAAQGGIVGFMERI